MAEKKADNFQAAIKQQQQKEEIRKAIEMQNKARCTTCLKYLFEPPFCACSSKKGGGGGGGSGGEKKTNPLLSDLKATAAHFLASLYGLFSMPNDVQSAVNLTPADAKLNIELLSQLLRDGLLTIDNNVEEGKLLIIGNPSLFNFNDKVKLEAVLRLINYVAEKFFAFDQLHPDDATTLDVKRDQLILKINMSPELYRKFIEFLNLSALPELNVEQKASAKLNHR